MKLKNRLAELNKQNGKKLNTTLNKDIYRLMYCKELYELALGQISKNKGSNTSGIDGVNISNTNHDKLIEKIITDMRNNDYIFSPARRTYIKKANGKLRPLGIPTFRDRLVEKAMLIILECIYHPEMEYEFSYGFIKGRSCQQLVHNVRYKLAGHTHVIEGDYTSAFDNVSHSHIITMMELRIKDRRFINLIRNRLKAGYMENKQIFKPKVGTPQGGILSPFLFNRAMDYMDNKMTEYISKHNIHKHKFNVELSRFRTKSNKLYDIINAEKDERVKNKLREDYRQMQIDRANVQQYDDNDPYCDITYHRYADDWIVLVYGIKNIKDIMDHIATWSNDMGLSLNANKTKITELNKGFDFLGYKLGTTTIGNLWRGPKKNAKQVKSYVRSVPRGYVGVSNRVIDRLKDKGMCDHNGFPISCGRWSVAKPESIILSYRRLWTGLRNYYQPCDAGSRRLGRIYYILQYSCLKTLGHHHKSSMAWAIEKYGIIPKCKNIQFPIKEHTVGTRWKPANGEYDFEEIMVKELARIIKDHCQLCGATTDLQSHHLNRLKYNSEQDKKKLYLKVHGRDSVTLCRKCHFSIGHTNNKDKTVLRNLDRSSNKSTLNKKH